MQMSKELGRQVRELGLNQNVYQLTE